ncbi:c-type cytochrome domain-containing protein [Stieleria varia]|uniref:Planctomycete cytochrome C n=1 Tax=Stieleria varia TaxID=2528005 RepID=A0A5C6B3A9_9BACT|nr:c-type cytochrome domain-containing protein [Stieleria varia]TWU05859.1 Planctomycete cytochrome C [Stieleria varia]
MMPTTMNRCIPVLIVGVFATLGFASEPDFDVPLAEKGHAFLKQYCFKCHGVDQKYPGLDTMNRATLLRPADESEDPFLVPGKSGESRLWDAIETEYMPPEGQPQPSAEEKEGFKKWIDEGAHFPPAPRAKRQFLGEETVLSVIEDDLRTLDDDDIQYTRYFSLAHLWNDTEGDEPLMTDDLRLVQAGLSKLVNSLSKKSRIVPPRIVDKEFGTVLAIDMRDYGWDEWHWNEVLKQYPYGLKVSGQTANNIYRMTQTKVPYLRADWFIAMASRPPLYHDLLGIPMNAKTLESDLGVDIKQNFLKGQLARAAFQKSGVSQQNRMVERHDTTGGGRYYWKSYDIKPGTGDKGDFIRRPLGPAFENFPGRQLAVFEHDGGEIIYSLPNGLQAYMLVAGDDQRIDQGPPDVVFDPNSHGGTFLITNGISCMGCHRNGMFQWEKDDVRPLYEGKAGQQLADQVLDLFPTNETMQRLVRQDRDHYLRALEEATGPFLKVGEDADQDITEFPEPVTQVSNRYLRDVTVEIAARELGKTDDATIRAMANLPSMKSLGLANWANEGGTISRENWERAFGRFSRELGVGVPIRVR